LLRALARSLKASISSVMSFRQFACIITAPTARITVKFHIEDFYENVSRNSNFG